MKSPGNEEAIISDAAHLRTKEHVFDDLIVLQPSAAPPQKESESENWKHFAIYRRQNFSIVFCTVYDGCGDPQPLRFGPQQLAALIMMNLEIGGHHTKLFI